MTSSMKQNTKAHAFPKIAQPQRHPTRWSLTTSQTGKTPSSVTLILACSDAPTIDDSSCVQQRRSVTDREIHGSLGSERAVPCRAPGKAVPMVSIGTYIALDISPTREKIDYLISSII